MWVQQGWVWYSKRLIVSLRNVRGGIKEWIERVQRRLAGHSYVGGKMKGSGEAEGRLRVSGRGGSIY